MTYPTLMVHLELGRSNATLLDATIHLARNFNSTVIGIAASQQLPVYFAEGYIGDAGELAQKQTEGEIRSAESEFRSAMQSKVAHIEWRSAVDQTLVAEYLAREARAADLVLTGVADGAMFDSGAINTGNFILQVGRPVLTVPLAARKLVFDRVLVAWKDTRETRRAVADALPLLKRAARTSRSVRLHLKRI
jgi:hypothetical protein